MKATLQPKHKMALWVLWFVMLSSLVIYLFTLWPAVRENIGQNPPSMLMLPMLIGPVAISTFFRWFVVTGVSEAGAVLVANIIGLAMAESLAFYGMFLFPDHFQLFFLVSALMVLQYIPLYTMKAVDPPAVRDLTNT